MDLCDHSHSFYNLFSLQGDFFALELLDGYLYLHLDLGSGSLKLRGSNRRVDDGAWHKLDVTRNRKRGNLLVDSERMGNSEL